jgi:ribonucleotide reductase beta subunit family protein with ferritin-like domain
MDVSTRSSSIKRVHSKLTIKEIKDEPLLATTSNKKRALEPILTEDDRRYVIYPIKYPRVWEMYKRHKSNPWTVNDIDMTVDIIHWIERLNPSERFFIENVLAFFASSDGIVNENLAEQFSREVKVPEAKFFYANQMDMENTHSEMYSLLIETLIKDDSRKEQLFKAITELKCVKRKSEWALKWINNENPFCERLVAFAAVEGIFFSGSFCAIFWLKKRGLMPGLCKSNGYISKDEALHCEFAILLFSMLQNKPSEETVLSIIKEAVECEEEFISESLPVSLIGMNATSMTQWIRFVADRLLQCFGFEKHYNVENPYEWMDLQSIPEKTNFFEKKVAEYRKAGSSPGDLNRTFSTDSPF